MLKQGQMKNIVCSRGIDDLKGNLFVGGGISIKVKFATRSSITERKHKLLKICIILANIKNTIILFVCPPKMLHKHRFQFLLGSL